jgi:hypothetical protein
VRERTEERKEFVTEKGPLRPACSGGCECVAEVEGARDVPGTF